MKKLFLCTVLAISDGVDAADWVFITENSESGKFYTDRESIQYDKKNNTVTVWEKNEGYSQARNGKTETSRKDKVRYFCGQKKYSGLYTIRYDGSNVIDSYDNSAKKHIGYVIPESIGETQYKAVCSKPLQVVGRSIQAAAPEKVVARIAPKKQLFNAADMKKIQIPDLSFKNLMRALYANRMTPVSVNDDSIKDYPYIGLDDNRNSMGDDRSMAVALMHPTIAYKNYNNETRYLVMIEEVQVYKDTWTMVTCHVCRGMANLFIFRRLENGNFQLVSKSRDDAQFTGSWGRTGLDLQEIRNNIQAVGSRLTGSYIKLGYTSTGVTESWWEALFLDEDNFIDMSVIADAGGENGNVMEDSPLYYKYDSSIKFLDDSSEYFPVQIRYQGEMPLENSPSVKNVDFIKTLQFVRDKNKYQ